MDVQLLRPVNRARIQQDKISRIQDDISKVERQMLEQSSLLNRMEQQQEVEDSRTQRIMDRLGRRKYVINSEVERLYGKDHTRRFNVSPVGPAVVEDIMYHRNKEHSLAQQEASMRIRYLNIERQRLQEARERLRERRNNLTYAPSPVGKETRKAWGDKYNIYVPLYYDSMFDIFYPNYSKYSPFLPQATWANGKKHTFYPKPHYRRRRGAHYLAAPLRSSLPLW